MKERARVSVGQLNLGGKKTVALQDGVEGGPEGALFKRSLLVYEGEFMGMFGPVKITQDLINVIVERFNREFESPKNIHDLPPLLVDHDPSADNIMGRVMYPLMMEPWENPRTGETVMGLFGDIRVDDEEAKKKVISGKYSQLSISFDDDIDNLGEFFETSFVGIEAARGAQVLGKGNNMDIVTLQADLKQAKSVLKKVRGNHKSSKKARLAAYATLKANIEGIGTESVSLSKKVKESVNSLKTNVLRSQLSGFVREGRLSKAEFDKVDIAEVVKMESSSQKIYLASFANRPISQDIVQHGMSGAEPLNKKGLKLSSAELRKAVKAQRDGKDYTPPSGAKLAHEESEEEKKKRKEAGAAAGDTVPDEDRTDLTMDDIEDALSKLEGLASMAEKLQDAKDRMEDTLSKLQDGDEKDDDDEEEGE